MKLAISNIAWPASQDGEVADLLRRSGVRGVEVAPTQIWASPLTVAPADVAAYREFWDAREIQVVALQALLYGRPDLMIFQTDIKRRETFEHLAGMMRLAVMLGAKILVFGSPKNRRVGEMAPAEAREIALVFFRAVAEEARAQGVILCIEPNPPEYGCDFLTTSESVRDFVSAVDSPGLGVHLDAGGMTLSAEPPSSLENGLPAARHFHISEPFLRVVGGGDSPHRAYAGALARHGYAHWVSIEMQQTADVLQGVGAALQYARDCYAPVWSHA